MTKLFLEPVQ